MKASTKAAIGFDIHATTRSLSFLYVESNLDEHKKPPIYDEEVAFHPKFRETTPPLLLLLGPQVMRRLTRDVLCFEPWQQGPVNVKVPKNDNHLWLLAQTSRSRLS